MAKKATTRSGGKKKSAPSSSPRKKTSGKGSGGGTGSSKSGSGASGRKRVEPAAKKKATRAKKAAGTKKTAGRSGKTVPAKASPASRRRRKSQGAADDRKSAVVFGSNTHDDLHAMRLIEELEFRHGIDVATIDIGIRDGKARVRGVVSGEDELEAVRETIRDGGGISELEYLVQVGPNRREEDRDRAHLVQEALDGAPDLESEDIQVASLGQKLVLRGKVSDPLCKAKAGLIALRQGDVQRIRNRIVVTDTD